MRVLVTGGTGFFGTAIATRLRAAGHDVTAAARHAGAGPGVVTLDVTSQESCASAFSSAGPFDAVVHAAALAHVRPDRVSHAQCRDVNALGTEHMVGAAVESRVLRFVYISSVTVYGDYDLPRVVTEEDPCRAKGVYGETKLRAEEACRARSGQIDLCILRMATMYSPDWMTNIRKRVRPFARGRPLYFSLDHLGRRYSLCSRRNGAEAVLWAVEGRLQDDVYNVADQYEYSQQEILEAVEAIEGRGWHVPVPMAVPWLMWQAVRLAVPSASWRESALSRYWKFCRHNVYSAERLKRHGLDAPPDLLSFKERNKAPAPLSEVKRSCAD